MGDFVRTVKYYFWYARLIDQARGRAVPDGYSERHHVLPKSMGGTNAVDNVVRLTAREHFIAHWLLTKCTIGPDRRKMLHALGMMVAPPHAEARQLTARQYEIARVAKSMVMQGCKQSEETKKKRGESLVGNKNAKPWTEATHQIQHIARKGRFFSEETRRKIGIANTGSIPWTKGKKHSEETKQRMREAAKRRPLISEATRQKMREAKNRLRVAKV